MDLILVFIIISIIANIAGAVKKSGQRQRGKGMPKSAASRKKDLIKGFRDILEMKPSAETVIKPVEDISLNAMKGRTDSTFAALGRQPQRTSDFDDNDVSGETVLESEKNLSISLTDVQRAIVMAEVLGKPKVLRR